MGLWQASHGQDVCMPIRDIPSSEPVVTSYNGRWWINELDRVGPVWGSFVTKEAAVTAGHAFAMDGRTTDVLHDESGTAFRHRPTVRLVASPAHRRHSRRPQSRLERDHAR